MTMSASGGVTALSNGNYVVSSPNWTNGAAANAGAVTWGSGTAGVSGHRQCHEQPGRQYGE